MLLNFYTERLLDDVAASVERTCWFTKMCFKKVTTCCFIWNEFEYVISSEFDTDSYCFTLFISAETRPQLARPSDGWFTIDECLLLWSSRCYKVFTGFCDVSVNAYQPAMVLWHEEFRVLLMFFIKFQLANLLLTYQQFVRNCLTHF